MKNKIIVTISFFLICWGQYYFLKDYKINQDLIGDIITFFSILFGFYITSLSIFVVSKYVSSLYKIVDEKNKSQTLLHRLLSNYKKGLYCTLFSILYFISIEILIIQKTETLFSNYLLFPFSFIIFFNIFYSFFMLKDLVNIILQEAKKQN